MEDFLDQVRRSLPLLAGAATVLAFIVGIPQKILEFLGRLAKMIWPGREKWVARASQEGVNNQPRWAYTRDPDLPWSSLRPQEKGMWYSLDMKRPCLIERVVFDHGPSLLHHPRSYRLGISEDGEMWEPFELNGPIAHSFERPHLVQHIHVQIIEPLRRQDGEIMQWSIHDIQITERRLLGLLPVEIT